MGDSIGDEHFRVAYGAMAEHAGLTLAQAAELRYDLLKKLVDESKPDAALLREFEKFEAGPPQELGPAGSAGRTAWFEKWITSMQQSEGAGGDNETLPLPPSLLQMLGSPQVRQALATQSEGQSGENP